MCVHDLPVIVSQTLSSHYISCPDYSDCLPCPGCLLKEMEVYESGGKYMLSMGFRTWAAGAVLLERVQVGESVPVTNNLAHHVNIFLLFI